MKSVIKLIILNKGGIGEKPLDNMNEKIIDFTQRILPKAIFKDTKDTLTMIDNIDTLNSFLNTEWNNFFEENIKDYNFIHAVRKKKGTDNVGHINTLIKLPYLNNGDKNSDLVTVVINTDTNNRLKYFVLIEIDESLLPITYVKSNYKYIISEINENFECINWGTIVNPRNLVHVSDSINTIRG